MPVLETEFILYVADQERSKHFYENLLGIHPCLHVPGMTEFKLNAALKIGLMPENGIAKIISPPLLHPSSAHGVPRSELYLVVENAVEYMKRAVESDAVLVSDLQPRDWGHSVGYVADPDGHVLAFAQHITFA